METDIIKIVDDKENLFLNDSSNISDERKIQIWKLFDDSVDLKNSSLLDLSSNLGFMKPLSQPKFLQTYIKTFLKPKPKSELVHMITFNYILLLTIKKEI